MGTRKQLFGVSPSTVALGILVVLCGGLAPAWAAGLACQQDCAGGACAQVSCGPALSGNGFCGCSTAALTWGESTYSTWCRAWGRPQPACPLPTPAQDQAGRPVAPPPAQLPHAEVMASTLMRRNPYVATLVAAMQDHLRWVDGPVAGLIHDSFYDAPAGALSHGATLQFVGQVVMGGLDAAQIDITVTGDLRQLTRLMQYADSLAPAAVPPRLLHGVVTEGGLHGSVQVVAADGRSETIQW